MGRVSAHNHVVSKPPYLSQRDAGYFQKGMSCAEVKSFKEVDVATARRSVQVTNKEEDRMRS